MRPLTPQRLLEIWEWGQGQGATSRALGLLAAGDPETSWEELVALPLGERDRRLFELREATVGSRLEAVAKCPACDELLDLGLDARDLRSTPAPEAGDFGFSKDGLELRFRLPTSRDLLAVERCAGVEEARRLLARRCVLSEAELAEDDLQALGERISEEDPGAELLLELRCPACEHDWRELLDVATFFWAELEVQVRRLLQEVDALARVYGWREADVLALSPRRRRMYLELVSA